MKAGKGGQVTRKRGPKLNLAKWKGFCRDSFQKLGYTSVNQFIEDLRGR